MPGSLEPHRAVPTSHDSHPLARAAAPGRPASAAPAPRRARAGALAALAAAALVPVYTRDQLVYALASAVAVAAMWLWGGAFARVALRAPGVGPCTRVYLGQFVLLAAAVPVTLPNHAAALLLGRSLPLPWLVLGATAALALASRRRAAAGAAAPRIDLLALLALGSTSVVLAICSRHLTALGLDTHQHVAWTRQIVEAGFVPLAEPPTRFVDEYPRSFHLLTALWDAAALGLPAGPFVKLMPFLQSALPALAIAECIVADGTARLGGRGDRRWQVAMALAFFAYAFVAVPLAYPWPDLSGTGRLSSNGILLLPVVLVGVARVHGAPAAARAALAVLPLVGAWALTFNPVVSVQVVTATCPLLAATWAAVRPPAGRGTWRAVAVGGAVSCALAAAVAATDPWVVTQIVQRSDRAAALFARAGLVTLKQAERTGDVTPREKSVRPREPAPPCDAACVERAVGASLRSAAAWPRRAAQAALADAARLVAAPSWEAGRRAFEAAVPLAAGTLADHVPLPFALVVASAVAVAAWRAARRRGRPAPLGESLLWATVVALPAIAMLDELAARLPAELRLSSHEGAILVQYLATAHRHLGLAFLWLPLAAAIAVLCEPRVPQATGMAPRPAAPRRTALAAVALAAWIALPLAARGALLPMRGNRGFWAPISLSDVRALRRVEAAIPPDDAVLVPSEHWNIAEWEHWVIPQGDTAALLPYADRKVLFDVYLGAGFPFSWRDLAERVCSADRARRRAFLERAGARWFLVLDRAARDGADAARRTPFCGATLEDFGVELPAVRSDRGIYLYRLRPAS